jgi:hypothetical protein
VFILFSSEIVEPRLADSRAANQGSISRLSEGPAMLNQLTAQEHAGANFARHSKDQDLFCCSGCSTGGETFTGRMID